MSAEMVLSIVSAIVAAGSAWIAFDQRRMMMNIASYDRMTDAESLLQSDPAKLLELHNVDADVMHRIGVTVEEVHYLIQNFSASDFYHRLDGDPGVQLTEYRRNLLRNARVRAVWKEVIRGRFISLGPFTSAVDEYVARIEAETGA